MAKLNWDAAGSRIYETGIDRCVLYYPSYSIYGAMTRKGVAWNGVTGVSESSSTPAITPFYFNGVMYYQQQSNKEFSATLTAITYPDEFLPFDGFAALSGGMLADEQTPSDVFCLSYRSLIGNDVVGNSLGYKIHILYNLRAQPSNKKYATLTNSVDLADFSWDITGTPIDLQSTFPAATNAVHIVIDSRKVSATALANIEYYLYGNDSFSSKLPDPIDLAKLIFYVKDNGDGTADIYGDGAYLSVDPTDSTAYNITYPGVVVQDDGVSVVISDSY